MRAQTPRDVDIIKELRLRRWAREHYVPSAERSATWHPLVLEEMARRDAEMDPPASAPVAAAPRYVPLAPGTIHMRHLPHPAVPPPNLIAQAVPHGPALVHG